MLTYCRYIGETTDSFHSGAVYCISREGYTNFGTMRLSDGSMMICLEVSIMMATRFIDWKPIPGDHVDLLTHHGLIVGLDDGKWIVHHRKKKFERIEKFADEDYEASAELIPAKYIGGREGRYSPLLGRPPAPFARFDFVPTHPERDRWGEI